MKRMHTFIFTVLAAVSAMAQDISNDMKVAFANNDFTLTYELASKCYHSDTMNLDCLSKLATSANKLGDQANAKKYFHILEKKDSSNINVFIQLAGLYDQQQQYAKAIKYYTIVNKRLPENPLYFRKNAALYKNYGDYMTAFDLYAQSNKLNPRDIISIKGLSELSMANDQMLMADSLIQYGLSLDSMNISMNYLSAKSNYKQKKYKAVVDVFDRIRGQVDLNSYYNKMLGYSYLQIDSVDLAISKLQLALVDDKNPEKLHYYLATAFEKKDNVDGALEQYEKAVESAVSPDLDLYHRNVGRIATKNGKLKKAISAYKDAYKYGQDPVVLYYLAAASDQYYKDKSIAISYYQKYIKSNHTHEAYRDYSEKRVRYLKEHAHQTGN